MAEDINDELTKLQKTDDCLRRVWYKFALAQIETLSQTPLFGPWYRDCVFTTGSLREGGLYARMFRHDKHIFESDYMFSMGNIQDPENQLVLIKDLPGYYSVRFNGVLECFYDGVREKFLKSSNGTEKEREFLVSSSVLEMTKNMFSSTATKTRAYGYMFDALFQPQSHIRYKVEVSFEVKGPSAVTVVLITSPQEHLAECRVDTVPCFKLSSWPKDWGYEEFLNRNRKWPSDPQILKDIQDMVHIVPKSSPELKDEREREECWRLSFSKAEMHLMSLFSNDEKRVYLLFKLLFYANIKRIEVDGKTLASYFCKTTMLWAMEQEGVEFCQEDQWEAVRRLFHKFQQFLIGSENGMPNFFCPSINLLYGYPQDLIRKCSSMAECIIKRPLDYLPLNFHRDCIALEKLSKRLNEIKLEDFVDSLSNYLKEREYMRGCTALELYWHAMQPRNWRVRLLFHPFVRALLRAWARRVLKRLTFCRHAQ